MCAFGRLEYVGAGCERPARATAAIFRIDLRNRRLPFRWVGDNDHLGAVDAVRGAVHPMTVISRQPCADGFGIMAASTHSGADGPPSRSKALPADGDILALIAVAVGSQKFGLLGPKTCKASTRHGRPCAGHPRGWARRAPGETSEGEEPRDHRSLQRCGVDGRDKPGHDDGGSKASKQLRPTNSQREKSRHFLPEKPNLC